MAGIDLPALAAAGAADARRPVRQKPISKAIRIAVDALTSGEAKTITIAAEKAGIDRSYLSRELSRPHIAEFLRQRAARVVAIAAGRASGRLVELLDSSSDHVSFDATKHTLAIAAIKPAAEPNISLNIELKAGYVIDLRDDPIDVTPAKPTNNSAQ